MKPYEPTLLAAGIEAESSIDMFHAFGIDVLQAAYSLCPSGRDVAVLALAARLQALPGAALDWYRNDPIAEFGGATANELVVAGRSAEVLAFLLEINLGRRG